jgi:hypothetical protein
MEPILAESASETVTAQLRAQLDAAVAALPTASTLPRTSCLPLEKQRVHGFRTGPLQKALPLLQSLQRHIKDKLFVHT